MSRLTRPHLLTGLALLGTLATAGTAIGQDTPPPEPDAVRMFTGNVYQPKNGIIQISSPFIRSVVGGTNGTGVPAGDVFVAPEKVVASMTVSVSAATKRKYKLTSSIIMRGNSTSDDATAKGSSGNSFRVKSTRAVAKKLRNAKTLTGVTYTLKITKPITETVTQKLTLFRGLAADGTHPNARLVRMSSSKDTFKSTDRG